MAELFSKEIDCVLCRETFSPVIQPPDRESAYRIYCSVCANWLSVSNSNPVKVTLREVLGIEGEPLALAFQTILSPCPCGGSFEHDAGKRCLSCIKKIERETRGQSKASEDFICPWNMEEFKKLESKVFSYILDKIDSKEESLTDLIEKFEAGEIDAETYMGSIEDLQFRESRQLAVIQTWSMMVGPEMVFRAAEEHGLVERYGTRILVKIAEGLSMSTGSAVLATLSKEKKNWDGDVEKELETFLKKIGGGF
jgi:hypothetical protein